MPKNSPYRPLLQNTLSHALEYLESLDQSPVSASVSYSELKTRLNYSLSDQGVNSEKVLDDLVNDTRGGLLGCAGGRFFGWVTGGALPASLAADWMTSTWDQNALVYAGSPAEAVIEEVCGVWLKDLLRLPQSASFALVTGCQMAHVTCLAAARHHILAAKGWNVEENGLAGSPRIRILTGSHRHGTIDRAVRLLGIGSKAVVDLPLDKNGRLMPDILEKALAEQPDIPTIVLMQAGDLNIGAYDPFADLIPIAHKYNAWVHIDGAFGLWVAVSPKHRYLVEGYEKADSWTTDGHKWLNVPYDCGYAFVAHPDAHSASISYRASYMVHDSDARDQMDWNPEFSRRGRGVATYAAIRQLGRQGAADLIDRTCGFAHDLVVRIGALPGAKMIWEPQINQGLVRYLDPSPNATETDHDRWTDLVIAEIQNTGEAFFGGTTWQGKRCMRVSVCNWQTNAEDVNRSVAAVQKVLAKLDK
ncbi:MAG: aminotransferase class V-fold PLP-dependent enzyme [Leptolinea sp.]